MVVIEPVIELEPSVLDPDAALPPFPVSDADWHAYVRGALSRVGLEELPFDGPFASIRDVTTIPGAAERLVEPLMRARAPAQRPARVAEPDDDEEHGADDDDEAWVDYLVPCGIAVRIDGVVRAWPGCCADWGALQQLGRAVDAASQDPIGLWMGHDCDEVAISACDPDTVILETTSRVPDESTRWLIDRVALRSAISDAWAVIDRFESMARPVMDAHLVDRRTVGSRERYGAE